MASGLRRVGCAMRNSYLAFILFIAVLVLSSAAFAGGPLVINPDTKVAYHW